MLRGGGAEAGIASVLQLWSMRVGGAGWYPARAARECVRGFRHDVV